MGYKDGKKIHRLNMKYFACLFDTIEKNIPSDCQKIIRKSNFCFKKLSKEEHNKIILSVLKEINSSSLTIAGKQRKNNWENAWAEIRDNFIKNYDVSELTPGYLKPRLQAMRLNGEYIIPVDDHFELNYYRILRRWLFRKYFKNVDNIYEFGCGPGFNLMELAKIYPQKKLFGLDWVQPPIDIVGLASEKFGYNITGHLFDMFSPDNNLEIKENSAVLLIHSLEQLGENYKPFIEFILRKSPKIVVSINTLFELYDDNDLLDYLAIKFEEKRNYIQEYVTILQKLEKESKVEIIKIQKSPFGSLFHYGYSVIIWRPI